MLLRVRPSRLTEVVRCDSLPVYLMPSFVDLTALAFSIFRYCHTYIEHTYIELFTRIATLHLEPVRWIVFVLLNLDLCDFYSSLLLFLCERFLHGFLGA